MNHTGLQSNSPNKYLGPNVSLTIIVSRPREPTTADYKQPETGKLYAYGTIWQVGPNPTTGEFGDMWILTKIVANEGIWEKFTGSLGTVQGFNVDAFTAPGTDPVVPDDEGLITITGAQVAAGVVGTNVIRTDSVAANQYQIEIQRSTSNATSDVTKNGVSHFKTADFTVDSNAFVSLNSTGAGKTITGDDNVSLSPIANNWYIRGQKSGTIPVMQTNGTSNILSIEDRTSTTAYVVDLIANFTTPGLRGTYGTIQTAIDAAPAGSTVFIKAGTYTENISLKAGVNLVAYCGGFTPTVTILGKCSFTGTGTVTLSGLALVTNSDYAVSVTGTNASQLYIDDCTITCNNAIGIQSSSSSTSSFVRVIYSWIFTPNASFGLFAVSGGGSMTLSRVTAPQGAVVTAQSTFSANGSLRIEDTHLTFPITTSGTGRLSMANSTISTVFGTNRTCISVGGDTTTANNIANYMRHCNFYSGMTTAITMSQHLDLFNNNISSENANPLSGSGALNCAGNTYVYQFFIPSTTGITVQRSFTEGGRYVGDWSGAGPSAGSVGEYIFQYVNGASAVALTTNVPITIASIVLTPGTWDVSCLLMFTGMTTSTYQEASINTVTNVINSNYGNQTISTVFNSNINDDVGLSIPAYRKNVPVGGGNITMYLVANAGFSAGIGKAYGRISATRVC